MDIRIRRAPNSFERRVRRISLSALEDRRNITGLVPMLHTDRQINRYSSERATIPRCIENRKYASSQLGGEKEEQKRTSERAAEIRRVSSEKLSDRRSGESI